jgi:hypothetical protein
MLQMADSAVDKKSGKQQTTNEKGGLHLNSPHAIFPADECAQLG